MDVLDVGFLVALGLEHLVAVLAAVFLLVHVVLLDLGARQKGSLRSEKGTLWLNYFCKLSFECTDYRPMSGLLIVDLR